MTHDNQVRSWIEMDPDCQFHPEILEVERPLHALKPSPPKAGSRLVNSCSTPQGPMGASSRVAVSPPEPQA